LLFCLCIDVVLDIESVFWWQSLNYGYQRDGGFREKPISFTYFSNKYNFPLNLYLK